ncbi:DNA repair protein Rad14 [Lophium mytilinum]|uniref:DNA repair protein RAD14 n=1 Tax=Lophium mytilinum TaxID=390894 RepID=A0A6A6QDM9_9PEZI|nr:DNA repair protein Rad14 [Lophium mytilinum]
MADRPSTPPRGGARPQPPMTPEQVRRMEEARLKAKALRAAADAAKPPPAPSRTTPASLKRAHSSISSSTAPPTLRDASKITQPTDPTLQPAKKFARDNYVEYDFSKMTDTKGGFLSKEDDPHNRAMRSGRREEEKEEKPAHMTLAEWERHQTIKKLRAARQGPFEPGISELDRNNGAKNGKGQCRECGSLEIDWKWEEIFGVSVCARCKETIPEKYSLLTKTEAREDYLLTDPELKDEDLLPHLSRPNPHKSSFHDMQLFLRFQVEDYAFSPRKWGSPENLDAEFEKRQTVSKSRKEKKFNSKLADLKKRTRVEAYKRSRLAAVAGEGGREAQFGDKVTRYGERHEHEWGRAVLDPESGMSKKTCVECGMEIEELEF